MTTRARSILHSVFGFEDFRPLQEDIIENALNKTDTLVIMPTGGGKSLCYQIPALVFDGLTIVVSPLISLMRDQVEQLGELGVNAALLNSSLAPDEKSRNAALVRSGKAKLLYMAPESLLQPAMLDFLAKVRVDCLTIDEAHCISEWGHDFRPEYRKLARLRTRFPEAVLLAFTATATPRVREDIVSTLGFAEGAEFISSFDRPNLSLEVRAKNDPVSQAIAIVQRHKGEPGIIYCFSRRQVDELSEQLRNEGFAVCPYHAGLTEKERAAHQDAFIRDDVQTIVATIAFGMGINKPNVRFVIHFDLPKNIESYYQEIGRAGRDGLRAECTLLFSYGDIQKIKYFINQKESDKERRIATQHLSALIRFAEAEVCRRTPLLNYFGEQYGKSNCGMCDNCTGDHRRQVDITTPAHMLFSCIRRSGERYGLNHIIDILRGSESQKIFHARHQFLSTYGIGKKQSKKQWQQIARQLIQQHYIHVDDEYGSLRLTMQAYEALRSKQAILGALDPEETKVKTASASTAPTDYDTPLFELLRAERKSLADNARVPPYAIFPDKTLLELATYFPRSEENMLAIHGVGRVKMRKYGAHFMRIIAGYCDAHNLAEREKPPLRNARRRG